jgi:hypothetical protein
MNSFLLLFTSISFFRIKKTASQDQSIHRTTAQISRSFPKNIPWVPNSLKISDNQKNDLFLNSCSTDGDNVHSIKAHSEPLITTHRSERMKSIMSNSSNKMNKESVIAGVEILTRMTLKNASTTTPSSSSEKYVMKNCTENSGNIADKNNFLTENENLEVKFVEKNQNQLCSSNNSNIIKHHDEFKTVIDVNNDVKALVPVVLNGRSFTNQNEKQNVTIQNSYQNINQNSNQNLINNKNFIKSIERDTKERPKNSPKVCSLKNMIKECSKPDKSSSNIIDDKTDTAGNRVSISQRERIDDKNKTKIKSNRKSRRKQISCQEHSEEHSEGHYEEHSDSAEEPADHSAATYFVLRVNILRRRNLTTNNNINSSNNGSSSSSSSSSNNSSSDKKSSGSDLKHENRNRNTPSAAIISDEGEICHRPGLFITTRGLTKRAILRSLSTQLSLVLSDASDEGPVISPSSSSSSSPSPSPVPSVPTKNVYPHITISHSLKLQHALQSIPHTAEYISHNTYNTNNTHNTHSTDSTHSIQSQMSKSKVRTITENQNIPVLTHATPQSDSVVVCISEETLDYIPLIDETSKIVISYL